MVDTVAAMSTTVLSIVLTVDSFIVSYCSESIVIYINLTSNIATTVRVSMSEIKYLALEEEDQPSLAGTVTDDGVGAASGKSLPDHPSFGLY